MSINPGFVHVYYLLPFFSDFSNFSEVHVFVTLIYYSLLFIDKNFVIPFLGTDFVELKFRIFAGTSLLLNFRRY